MPWNLHSFKSSFIKDLNSVFIHSFQLNFGWQKMRIYRPHFTLNNINKL